MLELFLSISQPVQLDLIRPGDTLPPAHVAHEPNTQPATDLQRLMKLREMMRADSVDLTVVVELSEAMTPQFIRGNFELLAPVLDRLRHDLENGGGKVPFVQTQRALYALKGDSICSDLAGLIAATDVLPLISHVEDPTRLLILLESFRSGQEDDLLRKALSQRSDPETPEHRRDAVEALANMAYGPFYVAAARELVASAKGIDGKSPKEIRNSLAGFLAFVAKIEKDSKRTHLDAEAVMTGVLSTAEVLLQDTPKAPQVADDLRAAHPAPAQDAGFPRATQALRTLIDGMQIEESCGGACKERPEAMPVQGSALEVLKRFEKHALRIVAVQNVPSTNTNSPTRIR